MTQSFIKNIFFILISSFIFFIDITLFACMHQHYIDLLFCFFIAIIACNSKKSLFIIPLLFMSLFSYLDTNIFGWSLTYSLPIIIIADYLDQHLHVKWIIPYLLITTGIILKNLLWAKTILITINLYKILLHMIIVSIFLIIKKVFEYRYTQTP